MFVVCDTQFCLLQLKGLSKKEASNQANKYLQLMEMKNQTKSLSKTLSGGMKRKLCLSIALMGKAEVIYFV